MAWAGSKAGIQGVGIYLAIYLAMNIGTFACILCMRQNDRMVEGIEDLKGLSKTSPMMALALAIFMFSMAGIPPLVGFFGKFYIFLAAIQAGLYVLAVELPPLCQRRADIADAFEDERVRQYRCSADLATLARRGIRHLHR